LTHAAGDQIKAIVSNVRKDFDTILAAEPQLPKAELWQVLEHYIVDEILAAKPTNRPTRDCLPWASRIPAG